MSIERRIPAACLLRAAILIAASGAGCAPTPDPDASHSPAPSVVPPAWIPTGAGAPAGAPAAPVTDAATTATPAAGGATAAPATPDAATMPLPAGPTTVIAEPADEAAYIYDPQALRTYELLLSQADLDILDADPAAEMYVPGMMRFEGRDYGPLGIRYKGSVGAFLRCVSGGSGIMPSGPKTCRKLSMKVGFDFVDPEGRFYGLRKLQFHAMTNDNSLMRERLGYGLFRAAGLAAPRAVHARLLINGRLEGIFVLVEQIDGRFTRSRYSDGGEGNLYKEVWPMHEAEQTYITALETNEDDPGASGAKMLAFAQALAAAEGDALGAVVDTYLDRDAITGYLAVDRAIGHIDGPLAFYCNAPAGQGNNPGEVGNHNYYWYEESAAARFWIVPWDLDFAFNGFGGFGGQMGAWYAPVAEMMCGCPESGGQGGGGLGRRPAGCDKLVQGLALLREPYEERLRAFAEGPFRAQAVDAQLDAWALQIAELVAEQAQDPEQISVEEWESALSNLRSAVEGLRAAAAQ